MKKGKKGKIVEKNAGKNLSNFLKSRQPSKLFVLCDDNTNNHCWPRLSELVEELSFARPITIYAGEENKNLQAVEYVWKRLTEEQADRNALLINLGGGMVCDLGGFAAATYKRGIDFIHVPTSLLGMVDAAIGGKQGIDFMHFKNQIGVFQQPVATIIDPGFLKTLPEEELKSGFAEVIKHALIVGGNLWDDVLVISDLKQADLNSIILESVAVKEAVVKEDPYEKDLRKVLNFGHTIGHALESFLLRRNTKTFHGYCIAAGMVGELYLSEVIGGLSEKKKKEAIALMKQQYVFPGIGENDFDELVSLMKQDKKNADGKIQMVLLEKIGKPLINCPVEESLIREALRFTFSS